MHKSPLVIHVSFCCEICSDFYQVYKKKK